VNSSFSAFSENGDYFLGTDLVFGWAAGGAAHVFSPQRHELQTRVGHRRKHIRTNMPVQTLRYMVGTPSHFIISLIVKQSRLRVKFATWLSGK